LSAKKGCGTTAKGGVVRGEPSGLENCHRIHLGGRGKGIIESNSRPKEVPGLRKAGRGMGGGNEKRETYVIFGRTKYREWQKNEAMGD